MVACTDTLTTAEMKRDVLVAAKTNPKGFLDMLKDPELKYNSNVQRFFDAKDYCPHVVRIRRYGLVRLPIKRKCLLFPLG